MFEIRDIEPLWEWPFKIVCEFYMPDHRKTDLSNKFESVADLLVKAKIIPDDNCCILSVVELVYKWVDKDNPRCEVNIDFII